MHSACGGNPRQTGRHKRRAVSAVVKERPLLLFTLISIVARGGWAAEEGVRTAVGSDGVAGGSNRGDSGVAGTYGSIGEATAGAGVSFLDVAAVGDAEDASARVRGGDYASYAPADSRVGHGISGRTDAAGGDGPHPQTKQKSPSWQSLRGRRARGGGDGGREQKEGRLYESENHARQLPEITVGTVGESFDVRENGASAGPQEQALTEGTLATPPAWDSTLCMAHWGVPELQDEPDPNGYVVYVNGREQLGGNKFLVSDGIFMAKALGRTFVEYPVKDARVAKLEEASIGLGAYWDLSELCMYHRILDLNSFRNMMVDGRIPPEAFTTIRSDSHEVLLYHATDEEHMVDMFKDYEKYQVIVMESTWKSGNERDALQFLRPNPFFVGIVRMLLEAQKDWETGEFVAVQWRTELSNGNLTECYQEVKALVEEQRVALGYGTHQVLFNTDLYGKTSGTYKASAQAHGAAVLDLINHDYPHALHNELHQFFTEIDDSGVRAFVSGLAVASSQVMIGSSLNDPRTKDILDAYRCEKPYSGYITLITEWREEILHKEPETVVRMFPFEYPPPSEPEEEPAPQPESEPVGEP
ncbi:unnamed protein product [Ectocarpus sp. CCAP 1310/34]|nr:unnamed protein product [Ectocarpus sp. CCAP 1310/34]